MNEVLKALSAYRYSFQNEIDLHTGLAAALALSHFDFHREYRLDSHDRPDFFLPALGMVIEVKIKFSRTQVLRQLFRYAQHDQVKSLMLVTTKSCHGFGSADVLNSKPLFVLNVGRL